jgi:hypothetical protein
VSLSFLEFMKLSDMIAPSLCTGGKRAMRPEPDFEVLLRIEERLLGAVGAYAD